MSRNKINHRTRYTRMLMPHVEGHDIATKIIHQQIAKKHILIYTTNLTYKYKPENIMENEEVRLYWNRTMDTDKTVAHKLDITLFQKKRK